MLTLHYKQSPLWRKAMDFAIHVNYLLRSFPEHEKQYDGLSTQLLQAVIRIPSRVAESYEPFFRSPVELLQQARFHLSETELLLELTLKMGYIRSQDWVQIGEFISDIRGMLNKMISRGERGISDAQHFFQSDIPGAA